MKWIHLIFQSHLWFYFLGALAGFGLGATWVFRLWRNEMLLEREWARKLSLDPTYIGTMLVEAKLRALRKEKVN